MEKNQPEITKRLVAAALVTAAVVAVSALSMHTPTDSRSSLARPLKNIQTEKTTVFYAMSAPDGINFVELVLPTTRESRASTENLKLIAAAF
jgi:hypothetical protein